MKNEKRILLALVFVLSACAKNEKEVQAEAGGVGDRFATSKMAVEEVEYQERELSRSKICELKNVETYSASEYKEYLSTLVCRTCATIPNCNQDMAEVLKLSSSIDTALATSLTRTAKNRMMALKTTVDSSIASFKTQIAVFEQKQTDERNLLSNHTLLAQKLQRELNVNVTVYGMSAAQLRALETLLTSAEFKAAIAASGVRTLNFVTTNFMSPSLSGGGHYYINPFSVSDGTTIVDPSKLVKNISALPTREQINQFQASVTAFGETGVKIDFATIDFQESITQLERIKGLASQFKEPTKYKLELSINSISCYASSYFKILTVGYKLTDEKFVECVNNPRVY